MKRILILQTIFFMLSGCITIYNESLIIPKKIDNDVSTLDVLVGDEEFENGSFKKLSSELKEEIKRQVKFNVSNACSEPTKIKKIAISFATSYQADGDCWLFNLCYLIWPAAVTGSYAVKYEINDSEEPRLADRKVVFRKYSHILLLPVVIFEPFDSRRDNAFRQLADSFSKELCN